MRKTLILCLGMVGFSLGMFTKTFANERIVASKHHITRVIEVGAFDHIQLNGSTDIIYTCLLYTSDAADERTTV